MIKIYGKGNTVSHSEYWDGRDIYNTLDNFLNDKNNNIAIRNIYNDNIEMIGLIESLNGDVFDSSGVVKNSFYNEFNISNEDYIIITINNITKYYARSTPGIAANNGYANVSKPATELASKELEQILEINKDDDEFVDIKYDLTNDKFKIRIHKIIDRRIKTLDFTNGGMFDEEDGLGFDTGIEVLHEIYSNPFLTSYFDNSIGDDLLKIDLEKTTEITSTGVYYWCLNDSGIVELLTNTTGSTKLCSFTVTDLNLGFDSIDNTHDYLDLGGSGSGIPDGGNANDLLVKQSSIDGDAIWSQQTVTGDYQLIYAEESQDLDITIDSGRQFSFGNGGTGVDLIIPYDCEILVISLWSLANVVSAEIAIEVNRIEGIETLSLNNVSSGRVTFSTPLSVSEGDSICFKTKAGTGGSRIVMSALLSREIVGLRGANGVDGADGIDGVDGSDGIDGVDGGASFFDGGTWDTIYQPDQIIDGGSL